MTVRWSILILALVGCTKSEPQPATPPPATTQAPVEPVSSAPPPTSGTSGDAATACTSDEQCVTVSSYCVACACFALREGASLPPCQGPEVKCLVDPCLKKAAKCLEGTCTLVDAP